MNEIISNRLKEVLATSGIKQSHLARKMGVQRQTLSRILAGDITRSKHFPELAKALGVTEEFLLFGNKNLVLPVDDAGLIRLIHNRFVLQEADKTALKDLLIEAEHAGMFFAHPLKIGINACIKAGSLIIYAAEPHKQKEVGEIYIVHSAVNASFVVGQYSQEGGGEYLSNQNGKYMLQDKDSVIGLAVQIILYLGVSHV